jgi:hypothetical protein
VEALTNRLAIPDEPSFVVRAVVVALGKIGPAASSALKALEDMVRTHRLAYIASVSILQIKGQRVPVW